MARTVDIDRNGKSQTRLLEAKKKTNEASGFGPVFEGASEIWRVGPGEFENRSENP
jgi:hypothetical protein